MKTFIIIAISSSLLFFVIGLIILIGRIGEVLNKFDEELNKNE